LAVKEHLPREWILN
jgi:hypothetical protein